ncbi:hypothetical protein [Brevibacillus choshinensis]|uniref:hypothetical protein n=1 Tax=Brevibacillus choshinensis TaxID=54911 RepID=UPI002E1AB135|nr:hypothetical protein [Brevibacillus choshinensis]
MTSKQYGFIIQALAEEARRYKGIGDSIRHKKLTATLQAAINIKQLDRLFEGFDEEQLHLISEALDETADRRQIWGTTLDVARIREAAQLVRDAKQQRESEWIARRFQEGIA